MHSLSLGAVIRMAIGGVVARVITTLNGGEFGVTGLGKNGLGLMLLQAAALWRGKYVSKYKVDRRITVDGRTAVDDGTISFALRRHGDVALRRRADAGATLACARTASGGAGTSVVRGCGAWSAIRKTGT